MLNKGVSFQGIVQAWIKQFVVLENLGRIMDIVIYIGVEDLTRSQ